MLSGEMRLECPMKSCKNGTVNQTRDKPWEQDYTISGYNLDY